MASVSSLLLTLTLVLARLPTVNFVPTIHNSLSFAKSQSQSSHHSFACLAERQCCNKLSSDLKSRSLQERHLKKLASGEIVIWFVLTIMNVFLELGYSAGKSCGSLPSLSGLLYPTIPFISTVSAAVAASSTLQNHSCALQAEPYRLVR